MAFGQANAPGASYPEVAAAQQRAQNALETANTAQNTANTANNTANAALEAANQALNTANDAGTTADEALETANGLSTSVQTAATNASTALETANTANQTANNALTAAQNAQTTANAVNQALTEMNSTINALPTQAGTLTYTGNSQTPTWSGYDADKLTLSVTAQSAAGTYSATFTPKDGYKWSDGTTEAKTVAWTIGKASLTVPAQSGTLTYTGNVLSPTWNSNYDSSKMTLGGTTSGTNATSYNATFTPKANYQWSDGTTTAKTVQWSIGKAAGSLSLNPTSMTLNVASLTKTIAVTRAGDGAITASSSNTSVATVSVSGTTVTVTAQAKGSATITVNVAAGTNHKAPSNKTCSVTVNMPSTTLNNNTPATIKAVAQAGTASTYWSVGDKIGIALNGTVGDLTLNDTYYAFILGFNHNSAKEGSNTIHFQFGKTSAGVDIAFVDSNYGISGSGFRMNTTKTNSGGWSSSYMRNTICPAFLSAMPTAWQNVIVACTKYSDNTGGGNNTASYVTSTSDKIWLLSDYEVQGTLIWNWANSAEKNYQAQYAYYANGNSKVKYQHNATGSTCDWWLRSVDANSTERFCSVYTAGEANAYPANYSDGFAPGFMVA